MSAEGIFIVDLAMRARGRRRSIRRDATRTFGYTLRLSRRDGMLHYVHMLDMPAASIESFARLPNDA